MIRKRSIVGFAAVTATAVFAPATSALATGFVDTTTDACNAPVNIATPPSLNLINHVFVAASDGPMSDQLWIAYGRGTNRANWGWFKATTRTISTYQQFACAAADGQALVVYRDQYSVLHSQDRLSNWTDVLVPRPNEETESPGRDVRGYGRFAVTINDQGRKKIALFSLHNATTGLAMNIWDDASNPGNPNKWGSVVKLGPVPGGTSDAKIHRLAGYAYDLGAYPNTTPSISVFVIGLDGHLWENYGGLTGRLWRDAGNPGTLLASGIGLGPTAQVYRATVGHPPPITEGDWNRRVMVQVNDSNKTVWAASMTGSAGSYTWQQLTGGSTNLTGALALTSGLIHQPGCSPGAPCPVAVRTVGVSTNTGLPYAENVSVNQSSGSWNILPVAPTRTASQSVVAKPDGSTAYDMSADTGLVYLMNSSSLRYYDSATGIDLDLGHP
jgi:hypothetical protein